MGVPSDLQCTNATIFNKNEKTVNLQRIFITFMDCSIVFLKQGGWSKRGPILSGIGQIYNFLVVAVSLNVNTLSIR